ncbi:hypothetical protein AX761_24250 [Rhizobium sp. 58]|nr:hypothetical protein AX761_24250 [Rhizobium sp. 58]
MDVTIRLSKLVQGELAHQPVILTLKDLRHTMLVDFGFPPAKVDRICQQVIEKGRCSLTDLEDECNFLLERVSH